MEGAKEKEVKRCKKQQLPPVAFSRSFGRKKTSDDYFERVETYKLVAALIATVTLSATFTMPGGYGQQQGFAILGKKPAFKPPRKFLCAVLLLWCSSSFGLGATLQTESAEMGSSIILIDRASLSMIVSLMTAVFLVVESESRWLSIVVIFIGCSTPWLVLGYKVLFFPDAFAWNY